MDEANNRFATEAGQHRTQNLPRFQHLLDDLHAKSKILCMLKVKQARFYNTKFKPLQDRFFSTSCRLCGKEFNCDICKEDPDFPCWICEHTLNMCLRCGLITSPPEKNVRFEDTVI